jgi:hypothetical protein
MHGDEEHHRDEGEDDPPATAETAKALQGCGEQVAKKSVVQACPCKHFHLRN